MEKLVDERTSELVQVNEELNHEIGERELGQIALFEAYNEIHLILSAISSVMIGVNNHQIVTQWNDVAVKMFNLSTSNTIGQNFFTLPIKWDWEKISQDTAECTQNNTRVRMDDILLEDQGAETRILGVTLTPLVLRENEPPGFLLIGSDISDRRLLELQLERSRKLEAIGELAAGVAHEINTPTQLVGSNLRFLGQQLEPVLTLIEKVYELNQAVKAGTATPKMALALEKAAAAAHLEYFRQEAPKAIEQSLEGIDRISHIVAAMRFFSHPGGDNKEMASLNQIIENALSLSRNEWKNVAEVRTDLDADLPPVECLPSELSQVVLNLIINAVHAIQDTGGDEGQIVITSRKIDSAVEVRIADNGSGIPENIRARIFDPFFTTKDVGRGTGQGLAIAHAVIVKKHGGTIEFESELGRGTTFIIRLPRKADYD
jgi:signal transduction histidine kinase